MDILIKWSNFLQQKDIYSYKEEVTATAYNERPGWTVFLSTTLYTRKVPVTGCGVAYTKKDARRKAVEEILSNIEKTGCMSKPISVNNQGLYDRDTSLSNSRQRVSNHGVKDYSKFPQNFEKFSDSFVNFIDKIPDKNLIEDSCTSIKDTCATMLDTLSKTISRVESQFFDTTTSIVDTSGIIKKVVLSAVIIFIVAFSIRYFGFTKTLGAAILGFVFHYFDVYNMIKNVYVEEDVSFVSYLQKQLNLKNVKVQGFDGDIMDSLLTNSTLAPIISVVLTTLFIGAIKCSPTTKNLEDLSRKIYNYQKGASSTFSIFDKMSEIWSMLIDMCKDKLSVKYSEGEVSKWLLYKDVRKWVNRNTEIFKRGFGEIPDTDGKEISYDEKKKRRRDLMVQYNIGLDFTKTYPLFNKKTVDLIKMWNTKIDSKVAKMSTEPLNSEMRTPPTVFLLYGRSGVGKTSMCNGIKALTSAVISDITGLERVSPANVYVRRTDMDHWDGYAGQQFLLFDDLCASKDSEANPNKELLEIICAKNSQPFPLKMAHLDDKGKYFTSSFIFCTTNVSNMTTYMKSMTYPEAVVSRLSELSYVARVKPQYRKIMSADEIQKLAKRQIHDQHYVDKYRSQYFVDDQLFAQKHPKITWAEADATKTISSEEFEQLKPDDVIRCGPGEGKEREQQIINYHIYYFEPYDVGSGEVTGPPIEWPELCEVVEKTVRERYTRGTTFTKQQHKLHESDLCDIKKGVITVKSQGLSTIEEEFEDCESFLKNYNEDLSFLISGIDAPNPFEDYDILKREMIKHWGSQFEFDYTAAILKREVVDTSVQSLEDEYEKKSLCLLTEAWNSIWEKISMNFKKLKGLLSNDIFLNILTKCGVTIGIVALLASMYCGAQKLKEKFSTNNNSDNVNLALKECDKQYNKFPWYRKLFNILNNPITASPISGLLAKPIIISRGLVILTQEEIDDIYKRYNYMCVNTEGGANTYDPQNSAKTNRSATPLSLTCATHGFDTDVIAKDLEDNFKGITFVKTDDKLQINFDERLIHPVLVSVQGNQLTNDAIAHVLPSNTYMMDYEGTDNLTRSIGNVTFLHDRAILFPYHYIQRLQHDHEKKKVLSDESQIIFSRAPTHLEIAKNMSANKLKCKYKDIKNFQRISSNVFLDDNSTMDKDAVIVNLSNACVSGHNCANIIKKFITREELSKLNSNGLNGVMVVQRNVGSRLNECTDTKMSVVLSCASVEPINVLRRTSNNWFNNKILDFQGQQTLYDDKGKSFDYFITLRDRYEYVAITQAGDCGSVLWIDHPQLTHCVVGMHSTDHPTQGKGCSVPITQEDILETLKKLGCCAVNAFEEPILEPLAVEDIFGVEPLVPRGNFQYIGKLVEKYPMQPLKTSIVPSCVQENIHILKNTYKSIKNKNYIFECKKKPAIMRCHYQNPEECKLFEKTGCVWFQDGNDRARKCTFEDYKLWLSKGGIQRDPLLEGLAKNCLAIPYVNPDWIDEAVFCVKQKLYKIYNPLCVDPFHKAMAQNGFYISDEHYDLLHDIVKRNALIKDCIVDYWNKDITYKTFTIKETYNHLVKTICLDKKEINVLNNAMKMQVNYEGINGMDNLLIEFAQKSREDEIEILNKDTPNPMILTIEQSVSGIDGDSTIRSINGKKSPGFPYDQQRKPFGKKYWVGKEMKCDGPGWPELRQDVINLIEEAKTHVPIVYFVDTMKDELRPEEKIKNFKTRTFSAGPMHFSIAFRMYFLRFLSFVMNNKIDNESAIGINPYGRDWEQLANHLSKFSGPTCIAGDYSNFDGSLNNQIMEKILDVVEGFYEQYGATSEEKMIRRNLWLCLTRSLHIARKGGVYRWYNSQPSGNPYTTFINVMYNMIVFRIVYGLILGRTEGPVLDYIFNNKYPFHGKPPYKSLASFDEHVRLIAYGDDNCANIDPQILDWFNMNTISRAMSLIGLTYTDEHKNSEENMEPARFLTDIGFLKRNFKRVDYLSRKWVAPLEIDTIKEILMWVRTQDTIKRNTILSDNVKVTCLEMVLHGEEEYNEWLTFITGLKHKSLLGKDMPTLNSYYEQFNITNQFEYDPM